MEQTVVFFILASMGVYALLIWYSIRSWKRVKSRMLLKHYVRESLSDAVVSAICWVISMFLVVGPATLLSMGETSEWRMFIEVTAFVPSLPYRSYFAAGAGIQFIFNLPYPILAPIAAITSLLSIIFVLLLVSLLESMAVYVIHRISREPSL